MIAEFAILGAGAIGSILGAHLARAGHSVIIIARGDRAHAVQRDGLRIKGLADFSAQVPVITDASQF
ncbi:MAG: ketopantoate reductase family protein, partial [Steroidobacteraceae bacterium]